MSDVNTGNRIGKIDRSVTAAEQSQANGSAQTKWDVLLRILEKQGFPTIFGLAVLFFVYSFGQSYLADADQNRTHSKVLVESQVEAVKLQSMSLAKLATELSRFDDNMTRMSLVLQSIESKMEAAHNMMAPVIKIREQELMLLQEIREALKKQAGET